MGTFENSKSLLHALEPRLLFTATPGVLGAEADAEAETSKRSCNEGWGILKRSKECSADSKACAVIHSRE